jgi:cytoskeletal protein CcmA (bactofilin family)
MFKTKTESADRQPLTTATLISSGTVFNGDVNSQNDLRIDGVIHGNVSSTSKIIIGPSGFVEGNIEGKHADITGRVVGNIVVTDLIQLRPKCQVHGNISAGTLQAENGAAFNGLCQMGANTNVVVMKEQDVLAKAQ